MGVAPALSSAIPQSTPLRRIALLDCNTFFASCEKAFRPDLKGKPVVVLSNNDGCVVAISAEAKLLGVKRAVPYFKVRDLIDKHNITVFSSNYVLYTDISHRVMAILERFTPEVEVYSIDEAFLHFSPQQNINCADIRTTVTQWTGIPVSIGVAVTKTLAKVANHYAKKLSAGVFEITESNRNECLAALAVGDVWGIGRAHTRFLATVGVTTALQFCNLDDAFVKSQTSIMLLRTLWELRGIPSIGIDVAEPKKTIISSRSFSRPVTTIADLYEAVAAYITSAAEKLRKQRSVAGMVEVYLTTNGFREDQPQYAQSVLVKLPLPSSYIPDMIAAARTGLERIYRPGYLYKKVGIMLCDISPENERQFDLFQSIDPRRQALMNTVDDLNHRYGRNTVHVMHKQIASDWMMRRDALSPMYTTRWDELPMARC